MDQSLKWLKGPWDSVVQKWSKSACHSHIHRFQPQPGNKGQERTQEPIRPRNHGALDFIHIDNQTQHSEMNDFLMLKLFADKCSVMSPMRCLISVTTSSGWDVVAEDILISCPSWCWRGWTWYCWGPRPHRWHLFLFITCQALCLVLSMQCLS